VDLPVAERFERLELEGSVLLRDEIKGLSELQICARRRR
jgi:hypothetical protein